MPLWSIISTCFWQQSLGCEAILPIFGGILIQAASLQSLYWNWGHPGNDNQSKERTETIDSIMFKSSPGNHLKICACRSQFILARLRRVWIVAYLRPAPHLLFCVGGFSLSRRTVTKAVGNTEDDLPLLPRDSKSCEHVDLILTGRLCTFSSLGNASKPQTQKTNYHYYLRFSFFTPRSLSPWNTSTFH